jgi:hypothetical protein
MLGLFQVFVQLYSAISAAFGRAMIPGIVHQNLPHESGGDGNKVFPVLGLKRALPGQSQVSFVHQGRGLQSVSRALLLQVMVGPGVEFVVDEGNQGFQGFSIARFPFIEQLADGLGGWLRHVIHSRNRHISQRLRFPEAPGNAQTGNDHARIIGFMFSDNDFLSRFNSLFRGY